MSVQDLASEATSIDAFFDALWRDYVALTPRAAQIRALFAADNPRVDNDHVAFRTFGGGPISLARLEGPLLDLGYTRFEPYRFEEKKLDAWGYVPPSSAHPRIFLSELRIEALSSEARAIVDRLQHEIDAGLMIDRDTFRTGRLWSMPAWPDYQRLQQESEYAAWVAVHGLRANHFTISINSLERPTTLEGAVERVEAAGHSINDAGGKLRGSPAVGLEQASTLADRQIVRFADGIEREVPTCYYEFARRHPGPDGVLFPGFVSQSADRIFESTDAARRA